MYYIEELNAFSPANEQEKKDKEVILRYIETFPDTILSRENEFAHMSSSAMIFNDDMTKVLMIFHNIYNSWSWTGGHADGDTDFLQIALKEAREETGLEQLQPLREHVFTVDILPVWSHMKRGVFVNSHLHLNYTYLLTADEHLPLHIKADENSDVRWLEIKNLRRYVTEPDMLPVYEKIINRAVGKNTL